MAKSGDKQVTNSNQQQEQQQQSAQSGTQNSTVNPWETAQPLLKDLIAKYSGMSTDLSGDQTSALANLNSTIQGLPDFGSEGAGAVSKFFNSSTTPQVGMLQSALQQLQGNIGGTASGAELDPYKTPGFSDAISTMTNDITNKVKGVYAGSGRDPSGAGSFSKSLGRGLTEGIAPTIAAQFNTNNANRFNAANTLFGAGGKTASDITTQNQIPLTNSAQGMSLAGMLQGLLTNPAQMRLGAANTAQMQPFQNLSALLDPASKLAGLGGQTSGTTSGNALGSSSGTGTGTSTTTQMQNPLSNILGGISGGIGLLSFLSDERAKEEIAPVGKLDDGQEIYRFRYKGDPRMQIGLLAQEVAEVEPDAVSELPNVGLLAVNYRKATDRAAEMRRAA